MKQILQSNFNREGKGYENISSPNTDGNRVQIESFVEEDEVVKYKTVGGYEKPLSSKVVDNLTTPDAKVGLSANQGVEIKKLIDGLTDTTNNLDQDKLDVYRYATNTTEITQSIATDIINNYANYEGKIIEFLSNGDAPYKSFAYGYVLANGDGDQFVVTVSKNDGFYKIWNKTDYEIGVVKNKKVVGVVDIDNLTIDNQGDPTMFISGLEKAINKPKNTSDFGSMVVFNYNLEKQIQLYTDHLDGSMYYRMITGTPDNHMFLPFVKLLNENNLPNATEGKKGAVELASSSDASLGIDTTKAITPALLKQELAKLGNVFDLKGEKATKNDLPTTNNKKGDVWFVTTESVGYVWLKDIPNGTVDDWEQLGKSIDLSGYLKTTDVVNSFVGTATDKPLSAYIGNQLYGMLANKVEIVKGKSLVADTEITKLGTVEENAQKNIQSDWNETNDKSDAFIKNKPTIDAGKLYDTTGQNTDGAMTQKAVTDELTKLNNDKVSKEVGKALSSNDFTNDDKNKLAGIEAGANKIVDYLEDANVDGETLTITKANGNAVKFKSGSAKPDIKIHNEIEQWTPYYPGEIGGSHGSAVWTDGFNIYADRNGYHKVLDKVSGLWSENKWDSAPSDLDGSRIWTDGYNIFFSSGSSQYKYLGIGKNINNKTWEVTTQWTGLTNFYGSYIWSDGDNIYYSFDNKNYVLSKAFTWTPKQWNGLTDIDGSCVWSDGDNIYYDKIRFPIQYSQHYILDKQTNTWNINVWNSAEEDITGDEVWTDGDDIYYRDKFVLNRETKTWLPKQWKFFVDGIIGFAGSEVWTDGVRLYINDEYVLQKTTPTSTPNKRGFTYNRFTDTSSLINAVYPIGSIYIQETSGTPNVGKTPMVLFPGTNWVAIEEGRFLRAVSGATGGKGGSEKHTHYYGYQDNQYYRMPGYESNPRAGVLVYDTNNNISNSAGKHTTHGQQSTPINHAAYTRTDNRSANLERSTGNTSYTSSLPPYQNVIMWKRIG